MIGQIRALIWKEILAIWRDKKSRTVLIIPPLVQLFIFSFAATLDVKNVTMAVLNKDSGAQAFELIQRFRGSKTFSRIITLEATSQIRDTIENQKAIFVLHINEQFSRHLLSGQEASVQFILDGRKTNTSQIVAGYASRIVDQFGTDFSLQHGHKLQSTVLIARNWFNSNLEYKWFTVPSLCGVLTMLIALIVTALSIAREREMGTFDQLLVSPLQPIEILIGKTIPAILISMAEGSLILLAAIFIFQIPFTGSVLFLYLSMFVFVCSVVGIGLFISSLANTQQQAMLGAFLFMSPSVLLSGFATPIENIPQWFQFVTYANPLRYFLIIVKGVFLKNMPFEDILALTWPMALIALFTLSSAIWFFRRRIE